MTPLAPAPSIDVMDVAPSASALDVIDAHIDAKRQQMNEILQHPKPVVIKQPISLQVALTSAPESLELSSSLAVAVLAHEHATPEVDGSLKPTPESSRIVLSQSTVPEDRIPSLTPIRKSEVVHEQPQQATRKKVEETIGS
jgi:hypothetical protein